MELVSVRIEESPQAAGRVRLVGEVAYDDKPGLETYWFEVDEQYAPSLSTSGDPWLACLLPLAATLRQDLRLRVPVDPLLVQHATRISETWTDWYRERYPDLRRVVVEADVEASPPAPVARETAGFFSGGIDSFFMVLRNAERTDRAQFPRIDRLVWVGGFDLLPGFPEEEFVRLRARLCAHGSLTIRKDVPTTRIARDVAGLSSMHCQVAKRKRRRLLTALPQVRILPWQPRDARRARPPARSGNTRHS